MYKLLTAIIIIFGSFISVNSQIIESSKINDVENYNTECYADYVHIEKEISKISKDLATQKWKGIITISRGGLYPALLLACKLDIKRMDLISLASYSNDKKQSNIELLQDFNFENKNQGEQWLVVDDLVDSGKTIEWLRQYLPKAYYVVVYAKPKGEKVVDKYGMKISQTTWIKFPWDIESSVGIPKCTAPQKEIK